MPFIEYVVATAIALAGIAAQATAWAAWHERGVIAERDEVV